MIPYATPELFSQDSVEKQLVISFTGGSFTNSDIETESFEWTDPMCSAEQLEFGECCAASVKFNIGIDSVPMQGKELTITITPSGGTAVSLGKFKVWSDAPTADRRWRTIEAYDAMADILNTECVSWYDGLFPVGTETYTVKQFRDSFFTFLGITQETVTLINDSETVARTISATSLSGKDVITAICQMNAVFGKIARDGKFKYVDLVTFGETLYPAEDLYPADDLYPAENTNVTELGANGTYLSCEYEDYVTDFIDKVQIRTEENDIGVVVGTGSNALIIENNFLLFGKGTLVLTPIATAIYNKVSGLYFQPASMVLVGNPLMECGDGIRLWTKYAMIDTYVLNRKMTGIQSLRDNVSASSPRVRSEQLASTNFQIIQLMGKSNKLTRNIEEMESEIAQIETDLGDNYYTKTQTDSRIRQTADSIESTVSQSITQYDTETYTINWYGFGAPDVTIYPPASHNGEYYLDNTSGELYLSDGSAWSVVKTLSLITTKQGTRIAQNASDIRLKVSKGDVSSEISAEAGQITISSNRFVLDSTNCKISADGKLECSSAKITGGSINIQTSSTSEDLIILRSGSDKITMAAGLLQVSHGSSNLVTMTGGSISTNTIDAYDSVSTKSINPYPATGTINVYGPVKFWGGTTSQYVTMTTRLKMETAVIETNSKIDIGTYGSITNSTTNLFGMDGSSTLRIGYGLSSSSYSIIIGNSSCKIQLGTPSGCKIGFFGATPVAKTPVNKASTSATLANVITKLNEVIDVLDGYGLL